MDVSDWINTTLTNIKAKLLSIETFIENATKIFEDDLLKLNIKNFIKKAKMVFSLDKITKELQQIEEKIKELHMQLKDLIDSILMEGKLIDKD